MLFLLVIAGLVILCLIVFGGGQVFMPLFRSFWQLLDQNGASITNDQIDTIFALSNATPGVVSTKFAAFTGLLIANGAWWGYLAFILTYVVFALPSLLLVVYGYKLLKKSQKHQGLIKISLYMTPVVAGTIIALAIQLVIGSALPSVGFNQDDLYFGIISNAKANFFRGWRLIVAIVYTVIVPFEVAFFSLKFKINIFYLILAHAIIGTIMFAPWAP